MFKNYYFIPLVIKLFFLLCIGYFSGVFVFLNNYIYTHTYNFSPVLSDKHKNFILIDAAAMDPDKLVKIIKLIDLQNPKLFIADIFHGETFTQTVLDSLFTDLHHVLYTLPVFISDKHKIEYFNVHIKYLELFNNYNHQIALYNFKKLYKRVSYINTPYVDSYNMRSLNSEFKEGVIPNEYKYINYNGNPNFAKLHAEDILKNNIISEVFTDKIIILSNLDNHYMIQSSYLEEKENFLHQRHLAFFLKSFRYDEWILELTGWEYVLFITIFIVFWGLLSVLYLHKHIKSITLFTVLLPGLIYWVSISYGFIFLPIMEMLFITTVINYFLMRHWQLEKEEHDRNLLRRITLTVQEKTLQKTFFTSDTYWLNIVNVIRQLVPVQKLVILEKVDGDTRIKEVFSYNCEFNEIKEERRDYRKEPYLTAVKEKSAVRLLRSFFLGNKEDVDEYLIPLIYGNKVIGFVAIEIENLKYHKSDEMALELSYLGKEVSKLLYERSEFIKRKQNAHLNIFRMNLDDKRLGLFSNNLSILEKRLAITNTITELIPSMLIAYNLFGDILHINSKMEDLLEDEKINVYVSNASEMLYNLTNMTYNESQEIIRNVTMHNTEYKQLVSTKHTEKRFLLTVSALTKDIINNQFTTSYIFDTYGIVFTFSDFRHLEESLYLKHDVFNNVLFEHKNKINALEKTIIDLMDNTLSGGLKKPFENIQKNLNGVYFSSNKLGMLMEQNLESSQDDLFPLNIKQNINQACQHLTKTLSEKTIIFNENIPDRLPYVLVSVHNINQHLITLLKLLADDSENNGVVDIDIQEKDTYLHIKLHSYGYGMPNELLMSYFKDKDLLSREYRDLHTIYQSMNAWGGNIEFSSELGEGITIVLILKIVKL